MHTVAFFDTTQEDQAYIKEHCGTEITPVFFAEHFSPALLKGYPETEAVSVFIGSRVGTQDMSQVPGVKLVTTRSTGFDHLDIDALSGQGIRLGYVPGYGDNTVAEFAFGLLLSVNRKICKANQQIRMEGTFTTSGYEGIDLLGKTMGIVGTGRIGRHAIRIAKGFGMNVVAYDPMPNVQASQELGFTYVPLAELLKVADAISLHVPYMPQTHHLINADAFAIMKKDAILINTSRGAVVDTQALLQALRAKTLGGAGLDVLEGEEHITDEYSFILGEQTEEGYKTVAENLMLVDMPNVVVTPHIAFYTREALHRILDTDLANIAAFFKNGSPISDIMASRRVSGVSATSSGAPSAAK